MLLRLALLKAGYQAFLDTTDSHRTLPAVAAASAFILLLSRSVLQQPYVLLEAWEAIKLRKTFITVNLQDGGYSFEEASELLHDLEVRYPEFA